MADDDVIKPEVVILAFLTMSIDSWRRYDAAQKFWYQNTYRGPPKNDWNCRNATVRAIPASLFMDGKII